MAPRATTIRASPSTGNIEPGARPKIAASIPARASNYTHKLITFRNDIKLAELTHRRRNDVPLGQEPRKHLIKPLRARMLAQHALRLTQLRIGRDAIEHALSPREREALHALGVPREEVRLARAVRAVSVRVRGAENRGVECGFVEVGYGWEVVVARG